LQLLGTPEEIIADSSAYLMIVFAGTIGSMLYVIGGGILRGMGDSKWPLYFLIFSSILNAILATIFVVVLKWGVAGTATATVISQMVSAVLIIIRLNTGDYGDKFSLKNLTIDKPSAKTIIRLGLPTGIQMMTMSLGMMIIQSFSNGFGSDFIAANNAIMRADGFAMLPMQAIGMAVTTFVGQNIGAGMLDRAKHGIKSAAFIIIGIGVTMGVILWFLGVYIIQAFTSDPNVIGIGKSGIQVIAFVYCFIGLDQCFGGAMRGAGAAIAPMVTGLTAQFLRIPVAYFLAVLPYNYMGLFYSMAITSVVSVSMIFFYYRRGTWRNKAVVRPMAPTEAV
jgi:putative MATE family efflux protein